MADENYAIKVAFEGINDAIADFEKLQNAVANIKAPVINLGGDEASKIAEASLKKLQLEIDALEAKKAQSAANDIARAEQLAAKQEANSERLLAQLEKQYAASNVRVTQGGNEGADKEAKFTAQTLQEALRYKQQLQAIDKAGFSAADAENAKQLAAGINSLNLEKIEKDFAKVNTGQRNFTGNLRDASELLGVAAEKIKAFKNEASAAFAEQRKATGILSAQATDAVGLTSALKGLAGELKNQLTAAQLTEDASKVASKGYRDTKDNIDVLRATEKLAIATQTDFQTALNATLDILKAYNLPASEAGKVTDQIAATARSAGVTVSELAPQYDKLASTAAATGTSFGQLNGFISNAAAQGVNAKTSVGALNQALESLQSGEFVKKGRELGIVFDEQKIQSGGLSEVLKELKTQGFDKNTQALNALFGNAKNVAAVMPSLAQGLDNVSQSTGLVDKNFTKVADNNKAVSTANALTDALSKIGEAAAPLDRTVGGFIRGLSDAFSSLPKPIQEVIGVTLGLAGAGFTLLAALTGAYALYTPTVGALQLLGTAAGQASAYISGLGATSAASSAGVAATGTAAAGATPAIGAFAVAANGAVIGVGALAASLVALGAVAVGAAFFLNAEKDLRETNDALQASGIAVDGLSNSALQAGLRTRQLNDRLKESAVNGKKLTDSQIADAQRLQKANELRIKQLDDEANSLKSAKVVDQNKGTRDQQLNQLKIARDSIESQNNQLRENLKINEQTAATFGKSGSAVKATTEELKKQAIALKETKNQDKEKNLKRIFDDEKLKLDIANKKVIEKIEEENTKKKGDLDRKQAIETESLKAKQQNDLQDKQKAFDDAQNAKKLAREQAIDDKKIANENKLNALKQAFDDRQNAIKEARAEKQRKDDEAFANARSERDKKNSEALSGAKLAIDNESKIATAKPEDRAKIAAQIAEENRIRNEAASQGQSGVLSQDQLIAQAKQIARVTAIANAEEQAKVNLALDELDKANKAKQAAIDKAEETKRAEEKRASDKAFELQQQTEKRAFDEAQNVEKLKFEREVLTPEKLKLEQELQAQKLNFERTELAALKTQQANEERALKLKQETEDAALKKASDAQIDAAKAKQKADELILDRKFEDEKIERERSFKEQQRALDKASAIEIQQILGKSAQQIIDAIAVAKGASNLSGAVGIGKVPAFASGVTNFVGGAALVGERGAELVTLPRGANVIPANQTRNILNSGGNKTYTFNITNAGDPMQAAYQVQRELARSDALASGI